MLLPIIIFLSFAFWTLFHWQDLPELLKDESGDETWPLSIHHTSTPIRLVIISAFYALFSYSLLLSTNYMMALVIGPQLSPWVSLAVLIGAHFTPYLSSLCSYIRYFFQRHLFFPPLPSHQEDHIIKTLMTAASQSNSMSEETHRLHAIFKKHFRPGIHAINLVALRAEEQLVEREFEQLRHQEALTGDSPNTQHEPQLRFHLYSCYRLLTRMTLARFWSGRERRHAFREMGYTVNATDGDIYARARRLRYMILHIFTHNRGKKTHINN